MLVPGAILGRPEHRTSPSLSFYPLVDITVAAATVAHAIGHGAIERTIGGVIAEHEGSVLVAKSAGSIHVAFGLG